MKIKFFLVVLLCFSFISTVVHAEDVSEDNVDTVCYEISPTLTTDEIIDIDSELLKIYLDLGSSVITKVALEEELGRATVNSEKVRIQADIDIKNNDVNELTDRGVYLDNKLVDRLCS